MWNSLLNAAGAAGNVLDLPGSSVRDALSGRNPLDQWMTPLTDKNRTSGRDLLRVHGLAGSKDTWGNFAGGMLAEAAMDPLNFIPGMSVAKAAKAKGAAQAANRGIDAANATSLSQRAAGFMPAEVASKTRIVDAATGMPTEMYHGTTSTGMRTPRDLSLSHAGRGDPGELGTGLYFTALKPYANSFATIGNFTGDKLIRQGDGGAIFKAFIDSRSPFDTPGGSSFGYPEMLENVGSHNLVDDVMDDEYLRSLGTSHTKLLQDRGHDSIRRWGGNDEIAVFDPSQIYLPYIAPAIKQPIPVPKITPAMMRLAMYNAAARTAAQGGRK